MNIVPQRYIDLLPQHAAALFDRQRRFMYSGQVPYTRGDSPIHGYGHYERVLYHALRTGAAELGDDSPDLEALGQAAVWHDSRRLDDNLDTGHGARAAVAYEKYCREHPEYPWHREVPYLMRYHDLDDAVGREAIKKDFGKDAPKVLKLYAIFKDADALDRPRLGSRGLDPRFLRTPAAKESVELATDLVRDTVDPEILSETEKEVNRSLDIHGNPFKPPTPHGD